MFKFDELTFITHLDLPDEDLHPDTRAEMTLDRIVYPELAAGWAWDEKRDEGFLAFCYVRQRWPGFEFGSFGWFQCEVWELEAEQPWLQSPQPPKPDWVSLP